MAKKAIIIGAGPAGLTAAYELLKRTDIVPIILEKSGDIGGISKTINYKGNRMDMGPHRFFSKSDRVMNWWLNIMPLETKKGDDITISYQNKSREIPGDKATTTDDVKDPDKVMLVIQRLTRIYFLRKFFAYPIQLSIDTLRTLGLIRTIKIMVSFLWIRLFPRKPEKSLEDFIINKFGRQLYLLFFKDYTEKVWGIPCHEISAEWGAQRIKGVSLSKAIGEALKTMRKGKKKKGDINQKDTETSLIEQFLYPKRGPGSLWEEVARQVQEMGGKIYLNQDVQRIYMDGTQITSVNTINSLNGQSGAWEGDYFFSTMPVQELIAGMVENGFNEVVPKDVKEAAAGLQYRDFINVGILLKQLSKPSKGSNRREELYLKDNWIYIQERDVKVGRLMIYNNWGDGMVNNPNSIWIGMEYFCNKTDNFWALSNEDIQRNAIEELEKMELANAGDVMDITVQRMEKTYPAYFGTYNQFGKIKEYTDRYENLFLVGRNGMHKYNNADHSMLTAIVAVDNICSGINTKANLWAINTEQEYHEEKKNEVISMEKLTKTKSKIPSTTFKHFVLQKNKAILLAFIFCLIIQFIIFKCFYPYPNFMPDSYSYLDAAAKNLNVNMWPIGYSKFLRVFSALTHSDTILIAFQYFFIEISVLIFSFTMLYFLQPSKYVKYIMLTFFIFNPITLYISNYISADSLFIGTSVLWATQLVWMLNQPKHWHIIAHALLLLLAITLRMNALFYPVISLAVIWLSRQQFKIKIAHFAVSFLFLIGFIWHTGNQYKSITGQRQFAAFGGWQLASNALYMYSHVYKQTPKPPEQFSKLDMIVRASFDSLSKVKRRPDTTVNIYYLWKGPLNQYMRNVKDSSKSSFSTWASLAPTYSSYGLWIIKQHPLLFIKYYIWPNLIRYYVPDVEFLGEYNMRNTKVGQQAITWFDYKSNKVKGYAKELTLFQYYPTAFSLINLIFFGSLIGFFVSTGESKWPKTKKSFLYLLFSIWLLNLSFSIIASPIVLRYQLFPMIITFPISLLLFEYLYLNTKTNS